MNPVHSIPGEDDLREEPTDQNPISVLIVEDHQMFGQLLASHLDGEPDIHVVDVVTSVSQALQFFETSAADLVLMDCRLPDGDGISLAAQIRAKHQHVRVVLVTAYEEDFVLQHALQAGCSGYVSKAQELGSIALAIRAAVHGLIVSPEGVRRTSRSDTGRDPITSKELTDRELDVLKLISKGLSTDEVASELFITTNTVRNHVQHIIEKLDTHSRLEAVIKASRTGMLSRQS